MNRNKLKTYAPQARREFIEAVTARAAHFGLTAKKTEPMTEQGDVVLIAGRAVPEGGWREAEEAGSPHPEARLRSDDGGDGLYVVQSAGRHSVHGTARLPGPRLPGSVLRSLR